MKLSWANAYTPHVPGYACYHTNVNFLTPVFGDLFRRLRSAKWPFDIVAIRHLPFGELSCPLRMSLEGSTESVRGVSTTGLSRTHHQVVSVTVPFWNCRKNNRISSVNNRLRIMLTNSSSTTTCSVYKLN